jgi:hypothetical protein
MFAGVMEKKKKEGRFENEVVAPWGPELGVTGGGIGALPPAQPL